MTRTQQRVAIWLACSLCLSVAAYWYSRAPLPPPRINVRWDQGVGESERQDLEKRFALTDGQFRETRTWSYRLHDWSRANVAAIVGDRRVEDTHNIDLESLQAVDAPKPLDGAGTALLVGFLSSTLAFVGVAHPGTRRALAGLLSRDSRAMSASCLTAALVLAMLVKAPSWRSIAWDDEELWMAVLKTATQARYWQAGTWLPLWDPLQGFGVPHPSATHLFFAPLFPLLLIFPAGIALSLHYSIMTAVGVVSTFVLCRKLGATPLLAGVGALTWQSSCFVTQLLFADFWAQAFTFANFAPGLVIVVLWFLETARTRIRMRHVLALGLAGGIVLNSTTPAGSVPFAVTLAALGAVFLRVNGRTGLVWLLPAFAIALAMYAPSLLDLWQEIGRFSAPRRHTLDSAYADMAWTALAWPVSGSVRSAGLGAPFAAVALVSSVTAFRADGVPMAWRACAAAAAVCFVMYLLPSSAFPLASGNGAWGQFLTIFAIPLAAAQVTAWYRDGGRRLRLLAWAMVLAQLALIGYWGARYWTVQRTHASDVGVGVVLDRRTELERALLQRIRPDRDRVLLSPSAEDLLLRSMRHGHASNLPRLGIPLVNGMFKFVSYRNVYPDLDATWGTIQTHDEQLTPESLDVAGVSLLITPSGETPADPSMRSAGRYHGLGAVDFEVWENLDVWPRVSFVDGAVQQRDNTEAGAVLWQRRAWPSRRPDGVSYQRPAPGRYSITFAAARADRFLLISDTVRTDLLSVRGASVVSTGPLADVFTILKVPAGVEAIDVTWERPLQRWLWRISYLTLLLGAVAYVCAALAARIKAPAAP